MRLPIEAFKPKLAVYIPGSVEVLRFVLGGAWEAAASQFDISYVIERAQRDKLEPLILGAIPDADVRILDLPPHRMKAWKKLYNAGCYQFAEESRSFAIRMNVEYAGEEGRKKMAADRSAILARKRKVTPLSLLAKLPIPGKLGGKIGKLAANSLAPEAISGEALMFDPEVYAEFRADTFRRLKIDNGLAELVGELRPLINLIPTSLLDSLCNEVLWLSEERRITSVIVQIGWDNLSSKGIVQHQPSYTGVWGPQSADHACDIQKTDRESIHELGAPHYEVLVSPDLSRRHLVRQQLRISDGQTLILFGGSFRQFDENGALQALDDMIENQKLNAKVVYRPHPYRLTRTDEANFFEMKWRHVSFDPDMLQTYEASKKDPHYIERETPIYSMNYLSDLLSAADVVISPMSTLMLEAMILKKPTMAVAFPDETKIYGASTAAEMTHFDIIKNRDEALIWCDEKAKFEPDVKRLIARMGDASVIAAQDKLLDEIVVLKPGTYAERLRTFVCDHVAPAALRNAAAQNSEADQAEASGLLSIFRSYAGVAHIPGVCQQEWLPLSATPRPVSNGHAPASSDGHDLQTPQWTANEDRAALLRAHGYQHVEAIGLPFLYLPEAACKRQPGSVLFLPQIGLHGAGISPELEKAYLDYVRQLQATFSHVYVCLSEQDYISGEWRKPFQRKNIPVIIGDSGHGQRSLFRLKKLYSTFECVVCEKADTQAVYAAHCGARVCIDGPARAREDTSQGSELSFLFSLPGDATTHLQWANEHVGLRWRRKPKEIQQMFDCFGGGTSSSPLPSHQCAKLPPA